MHTKAYFASSVPAALEFARRELGENALLVSSKPAPPQARQFGRLEVTFAWDPAEAPPHVDNRLKPSPMAERLTGVDELASRIPIAPFVEIKPGENRTLAFVGPPGRGKTISLFKIAVNMGLARRVPVRICCAGAHAVGKQDQAAHLAAILGTPFHACQSMASLHLALNGADWKGLTLIDTPGMSPADRSELAELQAFFANRSGIEKHLVLRADACSADMLHMVSRFSCLGPTRLLFTGMDEAVGAGSIVDVLIRGGIPATFAGTGQQIPRDLEEVNARKLARAVWASAKEEKLAKTAAA
jgi:flagellar biosynthesis GTPase FlhF